ncbi:unnamed protein product [Allacma fusca]|uniref:U6 snRNA-associated Sm-like protein LSm4 n=1 Tax=Allacma fusca TaxID=39272 RepID=A0A8J2LFQ8_9HEXA|nr:unnamed protein product [Allacma fusca]
MLPLSLLRAAQYMPMLVELKNGETYNGHLQACDGWMNICLRDVICTSRDGDKFWRMPECYIRGTNIKYLRIPDEVIELVKEEQTSNSSGGGRGRGGGFRGGRGGTRGRGGRGGLTGRPGLGSSGGGGDRGGGRGGRGGGGRGGKFPRAN